MANVERDYMAAVLDPDGEGNTHLRRRKRRVIASKSALALIHDDLYRDVYDGEAIMRRLVAMEPEVKLPTYVYTLLKRRIAAGRV
jgi:hypothetical protein